jgi:NAD(P)-dependent dehydrogenase (short-subunit alcohol dehydrogenase family)
VVAQGVAQAAVAAGRDVLIVDYQPGTERPDFGREPRVTSLVAALDSDAGGAALAETLRALGRPIDGIVATTPARPRPGRLLDQPANALREEFEHYLMPQLIAARHLLPLLTSSQRIGSYVMIAGPGSEMPWAGYGHRSVAAAAFDMLALVLRDEARAHPVRVQLLSVPAPVRPAAQTASICPEWPSALEIGQHALRLIARLDPHEAPLGIVRHMSPASIPLIPFPSAMRHVEEAPSHSTSFVPKAPPRRGSP